jgi:hypothetical protein
MNARVAIVLLALLALAACSSAPPPAPVIGEAWVGPAKLPLREDLVARAPVTATVTHGEPLKVIGRRRRFYRVRTAQGAEGWVDGAQLMTTADMEALRSLAGVAASAPSMGAATSFDLLNVHTTPNRQAPSFYQIRPEEMVDVIAHQLAPRTAYAPPALIEPPKPAPRPKRKAKKTQPEAPELPAPKAPEPPADWIELSGGLDAPETTPAPPPVPLEQEDWTLVRDPQGRAGWVLTRLLYMAIPDEVAQYAERHRITSYFSLGEVVDRGESKPTWLWTTLSAGGKPYQFDGARVFVWSTRRHRHETAYIERGLTGYYPVLVERAPSGQAGFSLLVEEKGGAVVRRHYAFQGFRVRLIRREPAERPKPLHVPTAPGQGLPVSAAPPPAAEGGVRGWLKGLQRRLSSSAQRDPSP